MKKHSIFTALLAILLSFVACSNNNLEEKGFAVSPEEEGNAGTIENNVTQDTGAFETKPSNILLTGMPQYRLATIYKVNYDKDNKPFIGSNSYHSTYSSISYADGNQWNNNYLPGFEVLSGYNMVNIGHYNIETSAQKNFFEKPVLVKTLYFPSFSNDTLNYQPVSRNFYMLSVYDEDTNKDGKISMKDLRRFYYFDKEAENKTALVPENYSVYKSEYDPANDYFYLFAYLDENKNGQHDQSEPTHIYWIDLKNPQKRGRIF